MSKACITLAFVVVLVLTAGGGAQADIAGQPSSDDLRIVQGCFERAKNAGSSFEACVGVLSTPCEVSALTPQAKGKCDEKEGAVWITLGAQDSARLELLFTSNIDRQALREAQTGYERAKFGMCTFERMSRGNSPDALWASSKCRLKASARYDLWLKAQIDSLTKK